MCVLGLSQVHLLQSFHREVQFVERQRHQAKNTEEELEDSSQVSDESEDPVDVAHVQPIHRRYLVVLDEVGVRIV